MWQKRDIRHKPKKRIVEIHTNKHHWTVAELIGNSSNGGLILKLPSGEIIRRRKGRIRLFKMRTIKRDYSYDELQHGKSNKKKIGKKKNKRYVNKKNAYKEKKFDLRGTNRPTKST